MENVNNKEEKMHKIKTDVKGKCQIKIRLKLSQIFNCFTLRIWNLIIKNFIDLVHNQEIDGNEKKGGREGLKTFDNK